MPVEVAQVVRQAITANYSGTASLEAENEAQVVAKTSGVLLKLYVEEGQRVTKGQILAQLDPERPQLQAAQAQANLKRLENDFRRSQEMYASKLTSSEAHDRIRFDLETQRATYDMAKLELSYTRIVAPIDGVISQRMVKEVLARRPDTTSANSISLGRLLPQMVYYAHAVGGLAAPAPPVISVPSGNFGNLAAGLMARRMGLEVASFVAATTINDTVPRYLASGVVEPRASVPTLANAMDVGDPSNLERIRWMFGDDLAVLQEKAAEVRAIRPTGEINANECHYCLDCQVTYYSDRRCQPLIDRRLKREERAARR